MASILNHDVAFTRRVAVWDRLLVRLRVLARAHRMSRARRAVLRLIRLEMRDPRWFADLGVDPRKYRTYDWIGELARAMGGRL